MNLFTQHTQRQGVTYFEHYCFAMGIAWRLLNSVIAFVLHAVFPFIGIEGRFDLEETMDFLDERNRWIEGERLYRKEEQRLKASRRGVAPTK